MGLFSGRVTIVDPYNTMGAAQPSRPAKRYVTCMAEMPAQAVARQHGLTLAAVPRFAALYDEADAYTHGPRSDCAHEALEDFLADKKNRKRW